MRKTSRPRSRHNSRRPLRFEALERRELLAGDVTAEVIDRTLFITGDNEANGVIASVLGGSAEVAATGGTTINGSNSYAIFSNHDIDNVVVNLRGGEDIIHFPFYLVTDGNVEIDGGAGHDLVILSGFLGQVNIGGNLAVRNSENVQAIAPELFIVGGDLDINAQRESAEGQVLILFLFSDFATVGGDMRIVTNGTEDSVFLVGLTIERNLYVNVGAFSDSVELSACHVIGSATLIGGSGADTATLNFTADGGIDLQKFELP